MTFVAAGLSSSEGLPAVRREYLPESSSSILSFSFCCFFCVLSERTVFIISMSRTRRTISAAAAIARQSQYFCKKFFVPKLTLDTAEVKIL